MAPRSPMRAVTTETERASVNSAVLSGNSAAPTAARSAQPSLLWREIEVEQQAHDAEHRQRAD
jgi:hypothetical protein